MSDPVLPDSSQEILTILYVKLTILTILYVKLTILTIMYVERHQTFP